MTLRCSKLVAKSISYRLKWWGGEARPTLADVQEQYLPKRFGAKRVRHSIHCNAEWRADWVCQSYVALEAGTDGGKKKPIQVRGIDQSLANASQLGKGLGTKLVRLWLSCCSMIPVSQRSKRTRRATCERSSTTRKRGLRRRYRNHPRWCKPCTMVQTRQAFERTRSVA